MPNETQVYTAGKVPKAVEYNDMYFSGAQTKVFFGNIWVDDIVTINWDLVEQKAPLYGYASETYDGVARGTQIVQGVFTIAFKQNEYISTIIDALNARGANGADVLARVKRAKARRAIDARYQSRASLPAAVKRGLTYEKVLDAAHKEGTGMFTDLSAFLRDNIWGILDNQHLIAEQATDKDKLNNSIESGFDILVTYGNIGNHSSEWTVKGVGDVHITGIRQILNPTGEPILEAYTFFGKLLDPYKEKNRRLAGIKGNTTAENSTNPFQDFFGLTDETLDLIDGYKPDVERTGPVIDTGGNSINDSPFDAWPENGELRSVDPAVTPTVEITSPTSGSTYLSLPLLNVQARLIGVPPGEALRTKFIWDVHFNSTSLAINEGGSLHKETIGPNLSINLSQMNIRGSGNGSIIVTAVYNGQDIRSRAVIFTVGPQD